MTTEELAIKLSADDPRPARLDPTMMLATAALGGLLAVLVLAWFWLRPRPDLAMTVVSLNAIFAWKLIFTVGVVIGALPVVRDLSTPGKRLGWTTLLAALPFVVIASVALHELIGLPGRSWSHHVGDAKWFDCLWQIPALALPAFAILVLGVRTLAPTNLMRTGAFLGLVAGALGAVGYALHCHDDAIAFVAVSYTAAMAEVTLLGALAGPRLLRWR